MQYVLLFEWKIVILHLNNNIGALVSGKKS